MPLTTSHPVAAIPLARLNLDLSALIIGSMTPDFVYFIPFCLPLSDFSHTLPGIVILCLPLGLAALAIFHYLIKLPALTLLPADYQSRLYGVTGHFTFFPLTRFLQIVASILAGALTHIVWDSFTHQDGWVVNQFVFLKESFFVIGNSSVTIYKILQHGSTVLGIVLLGYWYFKWFKSAKIAAVPKKFLMSNYVKITVISVMVLIAGSISSITAFLKGNLLQTSLDHPDFFRIGFIVLISIFTVELVLFGIYWQIKRKPPVE
jgi:hypothetical protein